MGGVTGGVVVAGGVLGGVVVAGGVVGGVEVAGCVVVAGGVLPPPVGDGSGTDGEVCVHAQSAGLNCIPGICGHTSV